MNTIRELIIQQLVARAAVIRNTASPPLYSTDIGAHVFREREDVDPSDLPCEVVWPQTEAAENTHGATRIRMNVQIDGLVKFGSSDPSAVSEQILGDIVKCFMTPGWYETTPKYIESMIYKSGGKSQPTKSGAQIVGMPVIFLVTYWTATGDPFSL